MNIYIPIEIKARELEGRTLLALAAAERGFSVVVGAKSDTISAAKNGLLPPGIVHMKSITPHADMIEMLGLLKKRGHIITVQDEEGGFVDESYDTFARLRFSGETISMIDQVFAWGEFDLKSLKEMYSDLSEKFLVTGSPRADFWRRDFDKYHAQNPISEELSSKPYIMIVSNFSSLMNVNRFWNIMARLRDAGYFERESGRERHEFENAAYQINLIGEFVFMIRELSRKFKDYNILLRPHPVENIKGWERLIGHLPNLYINRDGSISRWIRNSELIIHNGCTSGLEAAVSGINRIAYRPIPHKIEREIPNKVSLNAFSIEELLDQISELLDGKKLDQLLENKSEADALVGERFASTEGRFAADHIVDAWEKYREEEVPVVSNLTIDDIKRKQKNRASENKNLIKSLKRKVVYLRNIVLNRESEKQDGKILVNHHKFNEFRDEEMEAMIKIFKEEYGRFENVRYDRISEKSFLLTSKS